MKKFLKILLNSIIFTLLFSSFTFAKTAIVGNSIAANMAYYNEIDWDLPDTDKHCTWITTHAVGGDGWINSGIPYDTEYWNFGKVEKGYGKGFINKFIDEAENYNSVIIIIGSNEASTQYNTNIQPPEEAVNMYLKRAKYYLDNVLLKNPNIRIIFYLIPPGTGKSEYCNYYKDIWNIYIEQFLKENYPNVNIEKFENIEFNDSLHFTKKYYKQEFDRLVKEYNIDKE